MFQVFIRISFCYTDRLKKLLCCFRTSDSDYGDSKTVDSEYTTVFFDDATPNMPPLPEGINIMDTVCTDDIPLPPEINIDHHDNSSNSEHESPSNHKGGDKEKTTVSFAMKRKPGVIPAKSVFKAAEEEEKKLKLSFPKKKRVSEQKKLKDELEREKKMEEMNLEELYPSMPSADDKPQHRYPMKKFVKSDQMLGSSDKQQQGGPTNQQGNEIHTDSKQAKGPEEDSKASVLNTTASKPAIAKHDLLEFVNVTSLNDDRELSWPGEMVQYSHTVPSICFSCNPLSFDFSALSGKPQLLPNTITKKDKKKRKKKKGKGGKKSKKESQVKKNNCF